MKSEFQLIDAFARRIRREGVRAPGVVLGVGDDAAVLRPSAREDLVVTVDSMVEGRHFERAWSPPREIGWRLAAVNLSDIAAMGAAPRAALVSLAIPARTPDRFIEDVERGVVSHLARHGAGLIGGNVTSTDGPLVLDLTLVGACRRGHAWRRTARAGDAIVLAGDIGAAAAGVELLREGRRTGALVRAYRRPVPRLDVARALARSPGRVRGAIDVSDGLSSDLIHVCDAAGLGCDVHADALPIPPAVRAFCRRRGLDPVSWALAGGEDYALLLAVPARAVARVRASLARRGVPVAVIGRFTKHRGVRRVLDASGRARPLVARGWDHRRPSRQP